jgi:hypothetical protein
MHREIEKAEAEQIVSRYAALLTKVAPFMIAPASMLPDSRRRIEKAILTVLQDCKDAKMKEGLKSSFVFLAHFIDDKEAITAIGSQKLWEAFKDVDPKDVPPAAMACLQTFSATLSKTTAASERAVEQLRGQD